MGGKNLRIAFQVRSELAYSWRNLFVADLEACVTFYYGQVGWWRNELGDGRSKEREGNSYSRKEHD